MTETKQWYLSKVLYFNVITIAIGIAQVVSQTYPVPTETLALIVGIGNMLLRMFATSTPISVGGKNLSGKK